MARTAAYIWQQPDWPRLSYERGQISGAVGAARRAQGLVEGRLSAIGLRARQEFAAESWAQDAVATAAIEGERLDLDTVRSSVCRRLGVEGAKASRPAAKPLSKPVHTKTRRWSAWLQRGATSSCLPVN